MKKLLVSLLVATALATVFAAEKAAGFKNGYRMLYSDDFSQNGVFIERFQPGGVFRRDVACTDGAARLPGSETYLEWKGNLPDEYAVEIDIVDFPSKWSKRPTDKNPRWAGIQSDWGHFSLVNRGGLLFQYKAPNGNGGRWGSIDGFQDDVPVTLRLERKLDGDGFHYYLYANGRPYSDYRAPKPEKIVGEDGRARWKPIRIENLNMDCELRGFRVWEIQAGERSRNTIYNSGFEYDEDGIPPYVMFVGEANFSSDHPEQYEEKYLRINSIDRTEAHSGKQSLKIHLDRSAKFHEVRPYGAAQAEGQPAVFSAWMKASKPGTTVTIRYKDDKKRVELTTDWKRYEVVTRDAKPFAQSIARIAFDWCETEDGGDVWIDDWQTEFIDLPNGEVDPAKTYASKYMPCEADRMIFDKGERKYIPATRTAPLSIAENALNGYQLKKGETLVLGHYDYYMNEKTAEFRIWNEEGKLEQVSVDIAKLPLGENKVSLKAHGRTWEGVVLKRAFRENASQINNFNRAVTFNGKGVVFTGPCGLSMFWQDRSGKKQYPVLDVLAKAGFKQIHLEVEANAKSIEEGRNIMDRAAELGMIVFLWTSDEIIEGRHGIAADKLALLDAPNVFMRQVLDEPEIKISSDEAFEVMKKAKAQFEYCPTMMNGTADMFRRKYGNQRSDCFMVDDYLTNDPYGRLVDPLICNGDDMLAARAGTPSGMFVISDNMTLHYKNPSYGEQVAQSWGSICAGLTFVSWYVSMPSTLPTWQAMCDVNREVQQLSPALLSEELCGGAIASESSHYIRVLTRKYKNNFVLFTCNIDPKPFEKVTFTLPADAPQSGTVKVLFENRSLPVENGKFTDAFDPYARHVYVLPAKSK